MQDIRLDLIRSWLSQLPSSLMLDSNSLVPASSDASFRRYFRVQAVSQQNPTYIVMDAPIDKEDTQPFIQISQTLFEAGVTVPQILEKDTSQGFLLLTDLGKTTYLEALDQSTATKLYQDATNCLIQIQLRAPTNHLPSYDSNLLQRELDLFPEWFLGKHLNYLLSPPEKDSLNQINQFLINNAKNQPQVFVHRDFHSRNLMVLVQGNPGVLDFQDAVIGPITYDLVSLLRDAYIQWDEEQQMDWLVRYWEAAKKGQLPVNLDFGEFYKTFEWMGLQRHLKVLGIFARLYHRDGKKSYLLDLPLVLHYTEKVAQRYAVFKPLVRILDAAQKVSRPNGLTF